MNWIVCIISVNPPIMNKSLNLIDHRIDGFAMILIKINISKIVQIISIGRHFQYKLISKFIVCSL